MDWINDLEIDCIPPRILIVDHHDSYTHNLLICLLDGLTEKIQKKISCTERARALASKLLLSRSTIIPFTHPIWQDETKTKQMLLSHFDALILSPGPGRPDKKEDFGASMTILQSFLNNDDVLLPTLGICLGHQAIAIACGGELKRADNLRHGMSSKLILNHDHSRTQSPSIFTDAHQDTSMTTYNSLVVDETSISPESLQVTAFALDGPVEKSIAGQEERIVMGLQHVKLPIWGVQFHPESIASQGGHTILTNFLDNTHFYWKQQSNSSQSSISKNAHSRLESWRRADPVQSRITDTSSLPKSNRIHSAFSLSSLAEDGVSCVAVSQSLGQHDPTLAPIIFKELFSGSSSITEGSPSVWLDSARPGGHHSRYSFLSKPSWSVRYDLKSKTINAQGNGKKAEIMLDNQNSSSNAYLVQKHGLPTPELSRTNSPETPTIRVEEEDRLISFWTWLDCAQRDLQKRCETRNVKDIPFKTGFVGYFGYEMKHESLPQTSFQIESNGEQQSNAESTGRGSSFPSSWFGFCGEILVIDHETNEWHAIGLVQEREENSGRAHDGNLGKILKELDTRLGVSHSQWGKWTQSISEALKKADQRKLDSLVTNRTLPSLKPHDTAEVYMRKVEQARNLIAEGQSYELCLTTEFQGQLLPEDAKNHFDLYTSLRARNPAPFSAFLLLDSNSDHDEQQSILSTSPEKFFGIDADGLVEMKPIKGTSARAGYGKGEKDILEKVQQGDLESISWCKEEDERRIKLLHADAKERAENLMIVDLIRRDLLHSCNPDSVKVTKLMAIESYETVHQLVTTVQGRKIPMATESFTNVLGCDNSQDGIGTVEAIRQCFPPGSMTGAPKVRSVQLLEELEQRQSQRKQRGVYSGSLGWLGIDGAANFNVVIRTICLDGKNISVGAGGAITYHSKAAKEWQEVLDKVGAIAPVDLDSDK